MGKQHVGQRVNVSAATVGKVAVAVGALVGLWFIGRKVADVAGQAGTVAGQAYDAAASALWAITPTNNNNVIYGAANNAFRAVSGNEVDTLGTWLYGVFNTDPPINPVQAWKPPDNYANAWSTQGGQWNNPSAYTAPSGQGGAAFGIYPRP